MYSPQDDQTFTVRRLPPESRQQQPVPGAGNSGDLGTMNLRRDGDQQINLFQLMDIATSGQARCCAKCRGGLATPCHANSAWLCLKPRNCFSGRPLLLTAESTDFIILEPCSSDEYIHMNRVKKHPPRIEAQQRRRADAKGFEGRATSRSMR